MNNRKENEQSCIVMNKGTDIHIYTGNPSVLGGISF